MAHKPFIFAAGEYTMSVRFSADVDAIFADLGIEVEKVRAINSGLVIDRFDRPPGDVVVRATICTTMAVQVEEAALAA
ncbi:hypothetical protein [Amycolatopsis sp. Hca4]|uniref:hypothetical protein n=1 Tax=unclassified Amycolatopsis TaxID=2618356 RepID=UPI001591F11F|nr:hypothetical protein [Amycolatopsis sp. Hca4]QKV75143.1 hypothetical protein HUT10_16255 [Amycolatopsis sp. Hca4]